MKRSAANLKNKALNIITKATDNIPVLSTSKINKDNADKFVVPQIPYTKATPKKKNPRC